MTDEQSIEATVLDYFEGWFEGDSERMTRALHPGLAKRSLANGGLDEDTASEMIAATAAGMGKRIEVNVVEIHGPIATVVVHSTIYREYLHLGRTEDGWKIVNALWDFDR
jgi:putative lumazine-binding protein